MARDQRRAVAGAGGIRRHTNPVQTSIGHQARATDIVRSQKRRCGAAGCAIYQMAACIIVRVLGRKETAEQAFGCGAGAPRTIVGMIRSAQKIERTVFETFCANAKIQGSRWARNHFRVDNARLSNLHARQVCTSMIGFPAKAENCRKSIEVLRRMKGRKTVRKPVIVV